jgi:hypothetical protein
MLTFRVGQAYVHRLQLAPRIGAGLAPSQNRAPTAITNATTVDHTGTLVLAPVDSE